MRTFAISGLFGSLLVMQSVVSDAASVKKAAISPVDIRAAAASLGLTAKGGKIFDNCGGEAYGPEKVDLNKDGQPELIFGDGACLGGHAGWFGISMRTAAGQWREILSEQGVYEVLKTARQGWSDIQVGGPGCEGSDPKYSWNSGKYVVSGRKPRRCTDGLASETPPAPSGDSSSRQAPNALLSGSFTFPTDSTSNCGISPDKVMRLTQLMNSGNWPGLISETVAQGCGSDLAYYNIGRSFYKLRKPDVAAVYLQRAISIASDKNSPRELVCKRNACGVDIRYYAASLMTNVEKLLSGQSVYNDTSPSPAQRVREPATINSGVWSLGRARFLVEPRGGCGPETSLGTRSYCFNQAIDWLRRHPDRQSVDVVAMQNAWLPGSFVPHNSGQGWDIYKVSRQGEDFRADKQRHYATKVQVPQGCMYSGVADQAWYITLGGRGKVAVEAANYVCMNPWAGRPIYTAYLNTQEVDGMPGDIQIADLRPQSRQSYTQQAEATRQPSTYTDSVPSADFGGPMLRNNWQSGTSAVISGSPNIERPAAKPRATRKK